VLQKKDKIGPQLHVFLGVEFLDLGMFGNAEQEKREQSSPKHAFGLI
jgi:hypothetical protein